MHGLLHHICRLPALPQVKVGERFAAEDGAVSTHPVSTHPAGLKLKLRRSS
jgi:hypothetical protein